uniref:uncharacterized protein LOC130485971 n=1 Tax=Euleptes europaea TaxID=460621 RepID=UPI002541D06A|nr:uncharacterized protein LOC130485971 [Euleptes europaea]
MASIEHSLVMVLSSLLVAGGYSFPGLPADSLLVAAGQWEWKTAGEAGHESPPLARRKREIGLPIESSNKSTLAATIPLILEEETTEPFTVPTTQSLEEDETTPPGLAGKGSSAETTAMSSPPRDPSTEAPVAPLTTVVNTAPLRGQMTPAGLSEGFTETEDTQDGSRPSHTMDTAQRNSTATPQTSAGSSAPSVVTLGPVSKSGAKTRGSTGSSLSPPMAKSRPIPTVQTGPPSKEAPQGPDKMLGQCLLAISLLALAAGVFIIATFVLATLLLRQKRAYKLRKQHSHTEMVCISSLLAAEEAEASGGRLSRVRRAPLGQNGSETDLDNLTLNSFLPDH